MKTANNKFVARQAILDKSKQTFAYELLYRNSMKNCYTGASPEQSTSQIIFQNHILGDLKELCMGKFAFINFDERSLLAKLPQYLDKKQVVIEILEDVNITKILSMKYLNFIKKGIKLH